jgi:hypothetical protein
MAQSDFKALHEAEFLRLLDRAEKEYKVHCDTWDGIDRKAQATVTISGVFLGALFAFIPRFNAHAETLLVVLVLAEMGILLVSIAASLWATSARPSSSAPSAATHLPTLQARIAAQKGDEDVNTDRLEAYREWADDWLTANASVDAVNHEKSVFLRIGQFALFVAAILTVFLGAVMLLSATRPDAVPRDSQIPEQKISQQLGPTCPSAARSPDAPYAITITNNVSSDACPGTPSTTVVQRKKSSAPSCPMPVCPSR